MAIQVRIPTPLRRFTADRRNVFVNGDDIRSLNGVSTPLSYGDTVTIVPAVAGGTGATPSREEVLRYSRHLTVPDVTIEGEPRPKRGRGGRSAIWSTTRPSAAFRGGRRRRSAKAVVLLKRAGFSRARNLRGGILARAREVDASLPVH